MQNIFLLNELHSLNAHIADKLVFVNLVYNCIQCRNLTYNIWQTQMKMCFKT